MPIKKKGLGKVSQALPVQKAAGRHRLERGAGHHVRLNLHAARGDRHDSGLLLCAIAG